MKTFVVERLRAVASLLATTARRPAAAAMLGLVLMSASTWTSGSAYIEDVSSSLMGIRKLVGGDSEHYLAIADSLREGDFGMTHVEPTGAADRAHRQPGYPALLAAAARLGVQRAPELARVNLALVVLSLWIAWLGTRAATGSALAGLVAAAIVYDAGFLYDIATERLLTEPLYVAVSLGAASAALSYLTRPGAAALLGAAALAGLAYDVRVNGLLLAVSLGVAMVAADLRRGQRADPQAPPAELALHLPVAAYAAALALFVVVTVPSWVPRVLHAGNPVYHGYLPNYLWVDDYDRAHVPGPPRYSLSTYVAEHRPADAVRRLGWGMQRVFWDTPRDKFGVVASIALLAAIVVLLALRNGPGLLLLAAGVLQAMPLAWTAMANPSRRLSAAALLPFAALVVGAAAAALLRRARPDRNRA